MNSPLVIHVPHASLIIPSDVRGQFSLNEYDLRSEATTSADLWTDLLAREAWPGATVIEAAVSRIVVDVERYSDDADEPMARVGRGMIYTHTQDGGRMRCELTADERSALKSTYYDPHWTRLRAAAAGRILIDLHSYPVEPWPVELDQESERCEIVLGADDALTPAAWRDALADHFEASGFTVGLNRPYSGVIDAGAAAAVMFEIRRDMLGNGPGSPQWARLVGALRSAPAT